MEDYYKRLAEKYLNKTASEEEEDKVLEWFASEEGQQYLHTEIDADLELVSVENSPADQLNVDSGKIFNQIQQAKAADSTTQFIISSNKNTWSFASFLSNWRGIAAAATGLLLMTFAVWFIYKQNNTVTHQTAFGETAIITLPDHSTVVLNGNTILSYSRHWAADEPRRVFLKGEAFFQVVHTVNDQLFIVNTSERFNVEVLGTAFNVSSRKGKTKVSLNSGKVRLNMKEKEEFLLMQPGELVVFDDASTKYVKKRVNPEVYSSWKNNKLIFENTSFSEIVSLLKETYGLTVEVSDTALLTQKLNGTVPNDNIDMLLEGLSQLFDVKISRDADHVEITAYP